QVSLQEMHQRFGPSRVLRYPEVVQALKLSDTQRTQLAAGMAVVAELDQEQLVTWKDLTGAPFEGKLAAAPGFVKSPFEPTPPRELVYLKARDVQAELGLTEGQIEQLAELESQRREAVKGFGKLSPADQAKKAAEVGEAVRKGLADLLKPAQ